MSGINPQQPQAPQFGQQQGQQQGQQFGQQQGQQFGQPLQSNPNSSYGSELLKTDFQKRDEERIKEQEKRDKDKQEREEKWKQEKEQREKDKEISKEKFGPRVLDYNKPADFKNMTTDDIMKWKENELSQTKHNISVPVTGRDISQILDNYRDPITNGNIDDQIESISARLQSINTSYELEDANKNFKTSSVENKASELFGKDIKTRWEFFIEDFKDNWNIFKKFNASLFELPTIENWKYVIFTIIVLVSYRLSILHQDFQISQLRTIFPNLFLIGSIVYTLFAFTKGKDVFFGNGDHSYATLIVFCSILFILALTNVVDIPEYITALFNPNIIDKLIVIPILLLIFGNFLLLFYNKLIKSNVIILWFVITFLYTIDLIVNANNVSTSHIIWSLVAPALLVLLGKTPRLDKIPLLGKFIPITEITCGLFLALFINELFVYDIENIIFS